ncbi:hypothetical protein WN944_009193 [Citrus x changshan-huyou]|uniref:Uncharacterized protein n=1 Tax=Citrus x changshan-huyou TaxID=2935761 RepID=A0AAP0QZL6_9ROSI
MSCSYIEKESTSNSTTVRSNELLLLVKYTASLRTSYGCGPAERFELPLPSTYFGNCLSPLSASAKRSELMGNNGIVVAAKAIGRAICKLEKGR